MRRSPKNSAAEKLRRYFEANPDEELRRSDIEIKFGLTKTQIDDAVRKLKTEGFLCAERKQFVAHYRRAESPNA